MSSKSKITFLGGGPAFHPVDQQAAAISAWLGSAYDCSVLDGAMAFDVLSSTDCFVLMGLHWSGMTADWCGNLTYNPPSESQKSAFEGYVASGRPLVIHHGAIGSYDDWPRFGELLGFTWIWDKTSHSPIGNYSVRVLETGSALVAGITDFQIHDELYYDIHITPSLNPKVHAEADYNGKALPMIMTAEGGRVSGAGRTVYLANGHDMEAFKCPAMKTLWTNALNWALE
ncbi:MAG: ThuA domain-containing protein [Candidatus Sumerlaeaceae bacterium]|nr:ThuA domain-containing protein [Candidatus Sumerlaeaceae bacterium]